MIVKKLLLKDFRNYEELSLTDIDPKINLILGENAQGKTNLIEAIYFLSCGRSFRSATEERLIREGKQSMRRLRLEERWKPLFFMIKRGA